MKFDMLFAGVGGQGGLSISAIVAAAALDEGLCVQQSEVHGMSQRGGAVHAGLRLSDQPIQSPLIPQGGAHLLVSMEPLEALRYLPFLNSESRIFTAVAPLKNIQDYPPLEALLDQLRSLPHAVLVDAERLAREAGNARAANIVMLGAAASALPIRAAAIEKSVEVMFARKGPNVLQINLKAFALGQKATGL